MPDTLSTEDRSRTMRAVKGSGTSLERKLWAMLAGLRLSGWRRNAPDLPGRPDAAFGEVKVAVFVDGCFWHGCPHCARPLPQTNAEYWQKKITRNVERDKRVDAELADAGWRIVRIWGHEMKDARQRKQVAKRVKEVVVG